jgi:DNA-binding NtrC family response regulator
MHQHIKHILVVDEEVELRSSIIRHLRRNGFVMDSALGEEDAKRKIAASEKIGLPVDLVIRIVKTHHDDCIEFIGWVHRHHAPASIIIISGLGNMDWITTLLKPEKDASAQNPLTPEKLMDIIGDLDCRLQRRNISYPLILMEEQSTCKTESAK